MLGDWWDIPSLSSYDRKKLSHVTKSSYKKDVDAGNRAMSEFWKIINRKPKWRKKCQFIFLHGNHEDRRNRAMNNVDNFDLVDLITAYDFDLSEWDQVVPFLKIKKILGVNFAHYFQQEFSSGAIGTCAAILNKRHESCIAGHKQGFDYAEQITATKKIQAIICGASYLHKEEYKGFQTNHHSRYTVLLKNVRGGNFNFETFNVKDLGKK